MTPEQMIGLGLALLVMLLGLIGSILPGLPGTPLVFLAAVGHRLYFGQASVSNLVLGVLAGLMVVSLLLDLAATALGAKKFGATWRGAVGAVVGGLCGLLLVFPGIIIGPFIGALLFELLGGKEFKAAASAGAGATLGLLLGLIGKFALTVVMAGLFAANVILRSTP
jgi:uncharacterized protein YqgC (DUF456 family)